METAALFTMARKGQQPRCSSAGNGIVLSMPRGYFFICNWKWNDEICRTLVDSQKNSSQWPDSENQKDQKMEKNVIQNSWRMQSSLHISINKQVPEDNMVYTYNGIAFVLWKEGWHIYNIHNHKNTMQSTIMSYTTVWFQITLLPTVIH